ncbi:hypothetical protein, conserved [Babesia ovata]|uniref:Uncharacterized protein n=1 Tax=Babesia ovata TaxID=189622 RepID=A0A2H6K7X3_9APIC|nr:uncharacterized protein BOVATA_005900 [Babesia ovata]GBE59097.1 hypothetical protein, conserved [Babesia ovata]
MAPKAGAKGGAKKAVNNVPLRERLMAQGIYTSSTSTEGRGAVAPLFSPQKPARRSLKAKSTSSSLPKVGMSRYFQRKSDVDSRTSLSNSKSHNTGALHTGELRHFASVSDNAGSFAFMLDPAEVARVKEASEALLASLTSEESDCADVQIVDTSSLDQLAAERPAATFGGSSCAPLLNNPRGACYAMLRVPPTSHFGPFINTSGVMVLIFIDLPPGKLFYESLNLTGKRKVPCPRQAHVLVLPDDVFKLHNESKTGEASVLMLSCRRDGKEFNIEQHVQGAFLTPLRELNAG